jgi:hypothetical protein
MSEDPARMTWHRIAQATGSSLRQTKAQTNAREFLAWMAFFAIRDGYEIKTEKTPGEIAFQVKTAQLMADALNKKHQEKQERRNNGGKCR